MTQKFECDQCGACCQSLFVEAGFLDAMREPKLLDLYKGGDIAGLKDGTRCVFLWDTKTRACPFLLQDSPDKKTSCGIYPTRPNCCVGVEAGDAKCQQARLIQSLPLLCDGEGNEPDMDVLAASCEEYGMTLDDMGIDTSKHD